MIKPRRIVTAIDFSEASLFAMETALCLLSDEGGTLILVHVLEFPHAIDPIGVLEPSIAEVRDEAIDRLDDLIPENLPAGIEFEKVVLQGTPAKTIAKLAREKSADLIVAGTHGRKGLARVLLGSTAESLLREAHCQVLVAKHVPL